MGHYDVDIKRADGQERELCLNKNVDAKEGIMMWK